MGAVSSNSTFIVAGNFDGTTRIWGQNKADGVWEEREVLEGGTKLCEYSCAPPVAVSPDGTFIVTGGDKVRIWEENKADGIWEESQVLEGHEASDHEEVWSVAVSPDSSLIVTGCGDNTARIWVANRADGIWEGPQVLEGHTSLDEDGAHFGITVAVSPDSTFVVTGGTDGSARIWVKKEKIWEEQQ